MEDMMIKSRLAMNFIEFCMYVLSSLVNGSDGAFEVTNNKAKALYREISEYHTLIQLYPAPCCFHHCSGEIFEFSLKSLSRVISDTLFSTVIMSSTPVKRRESPWGLPEGDTRQPQPHRCNDRAEDVIQACFEGNPFKTVPGPFKLFWQCMRSKPGEEPTEPYTYLQIDPPKRQETILE